MSSAAIDDKEQLKQEHDEHLKLVEKVRDTFKKDITNAKDDSSKETLTFDLQKTLPLPRIPTNIVYYKRQIMMCNCKGSFWKPKSGILLCLDRKNC